MTGISRIAVVVGLGINCCAYAQGFTDFEKMKKLLIHSNEDRELNDENSKIVAHPFNEVDGTKKSKIKSQAECPTIIETHELTVQYLSPLVIRKELENIILNENQDNEYICFFDENFMQNHSIIFWNLIWYYKRIGVDCSCLENILLNHRIKLLAQKENLTIEGNYFEYKNIFSNLSLYEYHTHPYVRVFCLWDNLDLHNQKQNFEIPLYISWLRKNYKSFQNDSRFRLVTVLNPDDLINMKKTSINDSGLSKLFDLILRNVKDNEITDPFSNLVRDRFIAKRNFNKILFLIIVALERELIDIDAFDTEPSTESYSSLVSKIVQPFAGLAEKKPPILNTSFFEYGLTENARLELSYFDNKNSIFDQKKIYITENFLYSLSFDGFDKMNLS
ncbi:DENN domain-containing 4C [Brachionus plicatilis]|uniref:DENN domain-containing 4C n=1 Tax=Brachionus plicatilis TaxID=10195 RepID=A0A3M7PIS6_BRAPC|nr:DENN domain-containing 4C [Brachionus plicatilis]